MSKQISFKFDEEMLADLKAVSDMTGVTMTEIVKNALLREFAEYRNHSGRIEPLPAVWLSGVSEYERKVAENEGRAAEVKEHKCFILRDGEVFGEKKYRVYDCDTKNILTLASDWVKFDEKGATSDAKKE